MKKVLKLTALLFIFSIIFALSRTAADGLLTLNEIKVPANKGTYITSSREKISFDTVQCVQKKWAKDALTGVARSVDAKVWGQTGGSTDTDWLTTTTSYKNLGSSANLPGSYVMYLQATKLAVTAVTFYGYWVYEAPSTLC